MSACIIEGGVLPAVERRSRHRLFVKSFHLFLLCVSERVIKLSADMAERERETRGWRRDKGGGGEEKV